MYNSLTEPDKHNLEMSVIFSFIEILHSVMNTLTR